MRAPFLPPTMAVLAAATAPAAPAPFLPGTEAVAAQQGAAGGEWRHYGGDPGGTRYSPLAQIDRNNAAEVEVVWRWRSDNYGPAPEFNYRTTPLMVDGVLYATAGYRRTVVAIDAGTGETLWTYRLDEGDRSAPRRNSGRGVAWWESPGIPPPHLPDQPRLPPGGARRRVRGADPRLRRRRRHRPAPPAGAGGGPAEGADRLQLSPDRGGERGRRRFGPALGGRAPLAGDAAGARARVRRGDRRAGVDLPYDPAVRGIRKRDLGGRILGVHGEHGGVDRDERRPRARPRLSPSRTGYGRLLRRPPSRRQPLLPESGGAGRRHRRADLALPDGAPRRLGLRSPCGARPRGPRRGRAGDPGGGPDHQADLHLRLRPPHGRAGVADRGASRAADRRARRAHLAHAALPHQAPRPTTGRGSTPTSSSTSPPSCAPRPRRF